MNPALRILEGFAEARRPLAANEVAAITGLPRSSAFRVLKALRSAGFLFQDPQTRQYVLGPRILELGTLATQQLVREEVIAPPLLELVQVTGETVTFSVVDVPNRVCTFVLEGRSDLRHVAHVGARYPLQLGAAGKAILAHLPDEVAHTIVRGQGSNSLQLDQLDQQLAAIRERGFATTRGERVAGTSAIAAPVFLAGRITGSVAVAGPHERMSDVIAEQAEIVVAAARSVERRVLAAG